MQCQKLKRANSINRLKANVLTVSPDSDTCKKKKLISHNNF